MSGSRQPRRVARTCQVEADVPAPVQAVWRLVADVTRTGEWSHECVQVEWLDGVTAPVVGSRFRGLNKSLWFRWHRTCVVTAVEPERSLTWETVPTWRFVDSTRWRISLEPRDGGTRITQSYELLRCPRWWEWVVTTFNPPHRDRTAALAADVVRLGTVTSSDVATADTADGTAT